MWSGVNGCGLCFCGCVDVFGLEFGFEFEGGERGGGVGLEIFKDK